MTASLDGPMWDLALENADVLRLSTLFTAQQVPKHLGDDEGIDRSIEWCRRHGITHVYIESFRQESVPPAGALEHARDRFREAGFLVSGCITPAGFGRRSTGWEYFSCYTAEETRRELKKMSEYAARFFDEVMIDDFLCTDCECEECLAAKGGRSWADYRCGMMTELSRTHVIEGGRAVNPNVRFIIKYPCWHERFQERGYDVNRETELFGQTWVGTETRGVEGSDGSEQGYTQEPQYRAFWLMRWLLGIGGERCGGGWHDTISTSPAFYLEQQRQTILGGAREVFLFNFGALFEGARYDHHRGPADAAAMLEELPLHFKLARLIQGKEPRGLLGWKPMNSPPGPDANLHVLLGMAGFPVIAAHRYRGGAPGYVFGSHILHDPGWRWSGEGLLDSGIPVLVSPAFLDRALQEARANGYPESEVRRQVVELPEAAEIASLPPDQLDALRDRACRRLGLTFHAPADVAIHLFGDDLLVVASFRDEPAECELALRGWDGFGHALQMPAGEPVPIAGGATVHFTMPKRSLLALRRKQ
jgi:hypothetical protein